ncbi:MAG: hypothetical protein NZ853_05835 [Leptospiraceae bacterium]|nr:hypothetical protein [Leptospiraceae bacterium]
MKTTNEILPPPILTLPAQDMLYKPKNPLKVKVLFKKKLVPDDYEEDVCHVVLDLRGTDYVYTEGQSVGVIPPGVDENGKPHKLRLYSIASAFGGDPEFPNSVSLCVKRVVFKDENGQIRRGVGSNYICDLKEGDEVLITGPAGKHFVLPQDTTADLIFFATGTGIAPFRAFVQKIFLKNYPHKGKIILFFGSRYKKDHLYANEINDDLLKLQNDQFRIYSALSRENPNRKVYVHHVLQEKENEIADILERNNYVVYICGLKGMEDNIMNYFRKHLEKKQQKEFTDDEWKEIQRELEKRNRFLIETY